MATLLKLSAIAAAAFTPSVHAHMRLHSPPDFRAENNPHRTGPADKTLDYPYNCCGDVTPFPCRGSLDLLGTDEGRPVATWEAGSSQQFSLVGQGTHWGGSCQAGFSVDGGESWQVIKSWEGACPHREGDPYNPKEQTFDITVPADIPSGNHVFAWTWFNREQEFFMSCSPVKVTGGSQQGGGKLEGKTGGDGPAVAPLKSPSTLSTSSSPSPSPQNEDDDESSTNPKIESPINVHYGFPQQRERSDASNTVSDKRDAPSVSFSKRPGFLFANIDGVDKGCKTPRSRAEVKYPNPGPDVVKGDGAYPLELPEGDCSA